MRSDDICFSVPKIYFAYGFGNSITFPFSVGATTLLMPGQPKPDAVLGAIETYKPTVLFGLPTLYTALVRAKEAESADAMKKMSASDYEKLSTRRGGKPETKLFGSSKSAPKAKAKDDKGGSAGFTIRQEKINRLVSKKMRLLAKCKGGPEEQLKVTFTVALTGKVTSVRIKGTFDDQKKACVAKVFWRSVFPKGEGSLTLRKTIRL